MGESIDRWSAAFDGAVEVMWTGVFRWRRASSCVSARPCGVWRFREGPVRLTAGRLDGGEAGSSLHGSLSGERLRASSVARAVVGAAIQSGDALVGSLVRCGRCSGAEQRGRWAAAGSRTEDASRDWPGPARGGRGWAVRGTSCGRLLQSGAAASAASAEPASAVPTVSHSTKATLRVSRLNSTPTRWTGLPEPRCWSA